MEKEQKDALDQFLQDDQNDTKIDFGDDKSVDLDSFLSDDQINYISQAPEDSADMEHIYKNDAPVAKDDDLHINTAVNFDDFKVNDLDSALRSFQEARRGKVSPIKSATKEPQKDISEDIKSDIFPDDINVIEPNDQSFEMSDVVGAADTNDDVFVKNDDINFIEPDNAFEHDADMASGEDFLSNADDIDIVEPNEKFFERDDDTKAIEPNDEFFNPQNEGEIAPEPNMYDGEAFYEQVNDGESAALKDTVRSVSPKRKLTVNPMVVTEDVGSDDGTNEQALKWYSGKIDDKSYEISMDNMPEFLDTDKTIRVIHISVNSTYGWNVFFDNGIFMNLQDLKTYQTRHGKMPYSDGKIVYGNKTSQFENIKRIVVYELPRYFSYKMFS